MPFLNKLFGKKNKKPSFASAYTKASAGKKATEGNKEKKITETATPAVFSPPKAHQPRADKSDILLSPINTEKAMSGQNMSRYIFKVSPSANKIEISKAIGKAYNVKAVSVNIINVPRKARQVGKTKGFKSGYKKAVITLAKGQTIEVQPQ